jgi:hypothetical protein
MDMRRVRVGDSSGKVRLLRPVASCSRQMVDDDSERSVVASGWRGHVSEVAFVAAVWLLALVQVGMVVARGGAWTPDTTLALAFALACPLALRGLKRANDVAQ